MERFLEICKLVFFIFLLIGCQEKKESQGSIADNSNFNTKKIDSCFSFEYNFINFQSDTIEKSEDEKFEISLKKSKNIFSLCAIYDGESNYTFLNQINNDKVFKSILNISDTLTIHFQKGKRSYFKKTGINNFILPTYTNYIGSFHIEDDSFTAHEIHKFINETVYSNGYRRRSFSYVLKPYIPLIIYYPQNMFEMEIEKTSPFTNIVDCIKKSDDYLKLTDNKIIPEPKFK